MDDMTHAALERCAIARQKSSARLYASARFQLKQGMVRTARNRQCEGDKAARAARWFLLHALNCLPQ